MKAILNPNSMSNKLVQELMQSNAASWVANAVITRKLTELEDEVNILYKVVDSYKSLLDSSNIVIIGNSAGAILEKAKKEYEQE